MNKRIEWVDIGKYICIMFVMLSHLESRTDLLETFYAPFYLTVFFFLSGYVYKQPKSFKDHMIKKIRGLFVPWFLLSNFNVLLSSLITLKNNHSLKNDLMWNALQIRPLGDGMWFVAALFVAFIPFYFFIKNDNRRFTIIAVFILSVLSNIYTILMPKDFFPWGNAALPWHIEYIFRAMFWMVLGYYYRNNYEEKLDKYINKWVKVFIPIIYLVIIYSPAQFEGDIPSMLYGYIKSIVGIAFIIIICKSLKTNKYVSYVGANTLILFAFHGKVYAVLERLLAIKAGGFYVGCLNSVIYSSLLAIILTVILSLILIIPSYCINRWFPWVLGRKAG